MIAKRRASWNVPPYGCWLLGLISAQAHAQTSAPIDQEIVVFGDRSFLGIVPERTLSEDEVATYGLGTVGELLAEIDRESNGRREAPIYLIDGQRVSGLGDIDVYPTEAIQLIQVLPPGSANTLGVMASQRVVNIVLKPQVAVGVGRVAVDVVVDAGRGHQDSDVNYSDIRRPRRINVTLRARRDEAISERDRNIEQMAGAPTNLGRFRTLRPESDEIEVRASIADQLGPNFNGILTGRVVKGNAISRLGVGPSNDVIGQRVESQRAALNGQVNGDIGPWLVALDGSATADRRHIRTDDLNLGEPPIGGSNILVTRTSRAALELNATRPLFDLPAGPVTITLRTHLSREVLLARNDRFSQWLTEASAGLNIPLASSTTGALRSIGDLSASAEFTRSRASRVGALARSTFAFQWQPAREVQLVGSLTAGAAAPGIDLVASPLLLTPGVRYFDPLRGETVDIAQLSGGDPSLERQRRANRELTLRLSPLRTTQLQLTATYEGLRDRDTIIAFPAASGLLLRAFPERFLRQADGTLTQVDIRPIRLKRRSEDQIRFGLQLDLPPGRGSTARFNLYTSYTYLIRSEVILTSAFEAIDLLSADALGVGSEARPRHLADVALSYAERGLGLRLTGRFEGASFLEINGSEMPNSIRFAPLATFGARFFIAGQRAALNSGWLKGTRVTASILNLTNSRKRSLDTFGETPLRYQAAYFDPKGRSIALEFRKTF